MPAFLVVIIAVVSFAVFVCAVIFICALVSVDLVLKRKKHPNEDNIASYGVDLGWFDTVSDRTDILSLCSFDGLTLRAVRISHPSGASRVAVLQHGYTASPRYMQPYAKLFYDMGYDVILPAARAHDISDGKYVGMAWLDRFDYLRWLAKAVELYGEGVSIAALGVSMGGSTVVAASGMGLPPQVKCVVDDCGFSSQEDEYLVRAADFKLPTTLLMFFLRLGVKLRLGYSVKDADITTLAKNTKVPTLFIHGKLDRFVPCSLGKKLFDSSAAPDKRLVLFDDGVHAKCYASDPQKYTQTLTEFVSKYIN